MELIDLQELPEDNYFICARLNRCDCVRELESLLAETHNFTYSHNTRVLVQKVV